MYLKVKTAFVLLFSSSQILEIKRESKNECGRLWRVVLNIICSMVCDKKISCCFPRDVGPVRFFTQPGKRPIYKLKDSVTRWIYFMSKHFKQ